MSTITEKQCTCCKQVKPIGDFVSSFTALPAKRCVKCRETNRKAHRKYVRKNAEEMNAYQQRYTKARKEAPVPEGFQVCHRCLKMLPCETFPIGERGTRTRFCPPCREETAELRRQWVRENKEKLKLIRLRVAQKALTARQGCIEHYGGKCVCCGETIYEFLTFDHVEDDGAAHRREVGTDIIRWLLRNDYPDGVQVLCWNCQWGKRLGNGICPHRRVKVEVTP